MKGIREFVGIIAMTIGICVSLNAFLKTTSLPSPTRNQTR